MEILGGGVALFAYRAAPAAVFFCQRLGMTIDEARQVLAALVAEGVEFVLIGSMAMAAQGLPRATHRHRCSTG